MISVKEKEHLVGLMEDNMLENGVLVNSMVLEHILALKVKENKVFGKMERK